MAATHDPAMRVNYDQVATDYARHRGIHPGVLQNLVATASVGRGTRVLDVGCGTGNYARVLAEMTGCRVSGVEPSAGMINRARDSVRWEALVQGAAESLPYPDGAFDLVVSMDVIHHVGDRDAYFQEAARVLRPGGFIATVTDSHDDIARRRPLTSHFPETVPIEQKRYPAIETLMAEMARAGFGELLVSTVELEYELTDIQPYRDRAFSSLLLIDHQALQQGLARMEVDLQRGPISCLSLYSVLWGQVPRA